MRVRGTLLPAIWGVRDSGFSLVWIPDLQRWACSPVGRLSIPSSLHRRAGSSAKRVQEGPAQALIRRLL